MLKIKIIAWLIRLAAISSNLCLIVCQALVLLVALSLGYLLENRTTPRHYTDRFADPERSRDSWKRNLEQRAAEMVKMCCSPNAEEPLQSAARPSAKHAASTSSAVTFYIPVEARTSSSGDMPAFVRTSSIPLRKKRTSSETGGSIRTVFPAVLPDDVPTRSRASFETAIPHAAERMGMPQQPLSPSQPEHDEELERLQWESHPPLSPRGRMMQARQELAAQQEEQSYWNARPSTSALEEIREEKDLEAIVEESEEVASLRRNNSHSNRQTIASRQSSLRRPNTALGILDETGSEIKET